MTLVLAGRMPQSDRSMYTVAQISADRYERRSPCSDDVLEEFLSANRSVRTKKAYLAFPRIIEPARDSAVNCFLKTARKRFCCLFQQSQIPVQMCLNRTVSQQRKLGQPRRSLLIRVMKIQRLQSTVGRPKASASQSPSHPKSPNRAHDVQPY